MSAEFSRDQSGFHTWGGKDHNGDYYADCDCKQFYTVGFQDRAAMTQAVRQHSARHALTVVQS